MPDLVLVSKPVSLNVPYFAMGREPHSFIHRLNLHHELDRPGDSRTPRLFGRKVTEWVREHQDSVSLLSTRNYIPKKTALYLTWAAFEDQALATSFLDIWPHYNIDRQIE